MTRRAGLLWCLVLGVAGCHAFTPEKIESSGLQEPGLASPCLEAEGPVLEQKRISSPPTSLSQNQERGAGGLVSNAEQTRPHLSLAAAQLEKGDEAGACAHLALYLSSHPDHTAVRIHFAELLLRQNHTESAREQLERFEAEAQEQPSIPLSQRVRCESRLARIAEQEEDEYAEHLHRGIGLFFLAQERRDMPDDEEDLSAESLLFKSASELTQARVLHTSEARANWYLYEVWSSLSQRQAAMRRLHAAVAAAPFSYLTPVEHRNLELAHERERKSGHP